MQYREWIGTFMLRVSGNKSPLKILLSEHYRNINRCMRHSCCYKCISCDRSTNEWNAADIKLDEINRLFPVLPVSKSTLDKICDGTMAEELTQAMLRDLLCWSIFTDRIDMAKVLLLHIRSRICAALSCVAILRNRANKATTSDKSHLYNQHAMALEIYATDCINVCYSRSERKACELLIREVPLFGKITCMQVNIFVFLYSFQTTINCRWLFHHLVNFSLIRIASVKFSIVFGTINYPTLTNRFLET